MSTRGTDVSNPSTGDDRRLLDDYLRCAIHDLAWAYVTGWGDDGIVYERLYRARDHLDAALAILEQ